MLKSKIIRNNANHIGFWVSLSIAFIFIPLIAIVLDLALITLVTSGLFSLFALSASGLSVGVYFVLFLSAAINAVIGAFVSAYIAQWSDAFIPVCIILIVHAIAILNASIAIFIIIPIAIDSITILVTLAVLIVLLAVSIAIQMLLTRRKAPCFGYRDIRHSFKYN